MIIHLRGTSGTGKTTLVRRVMECYPTKVRIKEQGRKQPLGYLMMRPEHKSLFILGHYETPCGGCDTISKLDRIYELVRGAHNEGHDVLYEGLLISAEVNRGEKLHTDGLPLVTIALTEIEIDLCVESVNIRRRAKTPNKEGVNPRNTISKYKQVLRACERLTAAGVDVRKCSRETAWEALDKELRLS